ncbi:hypothetical protein MRB53_003740 [Persea americana]|uniref:Uncharacterized protein n=1 Tax=Persea americana TaxID=3435 RepID=A0ACC2N1H7_PERAE|nr:hypothetical protein MRB53_003740 [Persea americana]
MGRDEEADLILRKIYPPHEVETKIQDLKNSVESEIREEGSSEKINLIKLLKTKTVRRGLIAGVGLQVFQQFVGINTVMYYSPTIVQLAGFASNQIALLLSLITSGLNAMGSIVSIYFIDRTGRKKLDKYFLYYFHCVWLDQKGDKAGAVYIKLANCHLKGLVSNEENKGGRLGERGWIERKDVRSYRRAYALGAIDVHRSRSYLSKVAALGVNKVSVVASLMLLLFISSSLAIMATGADTEVCGHMCIPNCNAECDRGGYSSG